jgi:lipoate---protein ligase
LDLMKHCDLTLATPEENLACDETLLDLCEEGDSDEILRFWEPRQYFVVLGYGNAIRSEVEISYCEQNQIPILRRCSGGGTVLQGPGCVNYSVILRLTSAPLLTSISGTNLFVLERIRSALAEAVQGPIEIRGHTDLALAGQKFSGNAQRRKKNWLLFHGCFLLDMDFSIIERALSMPSRQPDYRQNRGHTEFLRNLKLSPETVKKALLREWRANGRLGGLPLERIHELARTKYANRDWTWRS